VKKQALQCNGLPYIQVLAALTATLVLFALLPRLGRAENRLAERAAKIVCARTWSVG
jgi:hypothetical protein